MISWMQKHRKYLVVTIWISTIAFVGAGFVGWGTYQYGSKSKNVAMVGDVPISTEEFSSMYGNIYQQYNRMAGGKLDDALAKKLGLKKQALQSLIYQALIKNFALDHGIVVSDEEVQREILSIPAFRKDGKFDKSTYLAVLQNMRMKPKTFEANIKNDLLVRKTLNLLNVDATPLETEAVGAALFMADRLRYKIFTMDDVTVEVDDETLKKYWEENKERYLTPKRFKLAILWVVPSEEEPSEAEMESYYREHRTDFTNEKGEILPLTEAKERIVEAIRLKKAKKRAQLAYIDFKKNRKKADEEKVLDAGDPLFDAALWRTIEESREETVLKPKIVGNRYVVVKIEKVISPEPKSFEEAYEEVKNNYLEEARLKALKKLAEKAVDHMDDANVSGFLRRDSVDTLPGLTREENSRFLRDLFLTNRRKGTILLDNKAVSYRIVEQRLPDSDTLERQRTFIEENTKRMKVDLLQNNLIARLQQKYPIEIFLKEVE